MLDKFRETAITWDKATRRIYSPITANASDSNGRKLNIQVVNSGQVENLTGATLHLYWETKDKAQHGLDAFKASDISKGEFEIFYTTGMLSNVGELNATLVLVDATGQVVSDWFKITVVRGIDGDAIQSENSFTSLTQALIDISNLEQNYAPRLNDLTAQLQQTNYEVSKKANLTYVDALLLDIAKGGPNGMFYSIPALEAAYPNGTEGTWLVFDETLIDGAHAFMWNSELSKWQDLGVYQAIVANSISHPMFTDTYRNPLETLSASDNLNNVKKDGIYVCVSPINSPSGFGTFYLEVSSYMGGYQNVARWTIQKAFDFNDPSLMYVRKVDIVSPDFNTPWTAPKTQDGSIGRTALASSFLSSPVILTNTTDLDDVKNDGVYLVTNALNKPTTLTGSAFLEVKTQLSDTSQLRWVTQTIRDYFYPAIRYTRQIDTVTPANSLPWRADYISPLVGKKVVFFGDSIPAGAGTTNPGSDSYPAQLISQYGLQVVNKSIGGASWQYDGVYDNISLIHQVENTDFSDVDIAVFHAGTNDFGRGGLPIGNNTDVEKTTMKGAFNYILSYIYSQKPDIKVLVVSPTWRQRLQEGDNKDSDFNAFGGKYLHEYVNALEEVSDYNHIKFLDIHHSLSVNNYNHTVWMSDGLHFNTKGHKELLAPRVHSALIGL